MRAVLDSRGAPGRGYALAGVVPRLPEAPVPEPAWCPTPGPVHSVIIGRALFGLLYETPPDGDGHSLGPIIPPQDVRRHLAPRSERGIEGASRVVPGQGEVVEALTRETRHHD